MRPTIDKHLNLVIPVETERGGATVHSSLISLQTFHAHWRPINRAFADIYEDGAAGGPRIAYHALKDSFKNMGYEKEFEEVFWPEVVRLTNVILPVDGGYKTYPLDTIAKQEGLIDEVELDEVYNAIGFFTVVSRMHTNRARTGHLKMLDLWGARIESLNVTALKDSLPTLMPEEPTGVKVVESVIPS